MTFKTPLSRTPIIDTAVDRFGGLLGVIKLLAVGDRGFEGQWTALNGFESIPLFCRAVRARALIDRELIPAIYRAWLNRLDPPPCRCGRIATRIIGAVTFCTRCGPPVDASMRFAYVRRGRDVASQIRGEEMTVEGKSDLQRQRLHRTKDRRR